MTKEIELTHGFLATVDDEHYQYISQYKWRAKIERRSDGSIRTVYAQRNISHKKTEFMHRLIIEANNGMQIDHIDGNGLNNTMQNLRVCTASDNMHNQRAQVGGSSTFKGVVWHKQARKWQAQIKVNGKKKYLGIFASDIDAAAAYNSAAVEHFGDFAHINLV